MVLLLLLWAVLLLPGALRARNSASPHSTVGGFTRAMEVLRAKPGTGREMMVPRDAGRIVTHGLSREPSRAPGTEDPVMARRRGWFVRLWAGAAGALLLAVILGGGLWLAFGVLSGAAAAYTVLLRRLKLQHDEARRVVRELALDRDATPEGSSAQERPRAAEEVEESSAASAVRVRRWEP